jgi:hypothetical protein
MLSLKAKNIMKSVAVAVIAALLCLFSLPWVSIFPEKAVRAIEKVWITDCHTRSLIIIYGYEASDTITFGVSGFLMAALISFVLKNNRMLTTMLALLIVTIIAAICSLEISPYIPKEYKITVLINLYLSFLLEMVFFWGFGLLGLWLVSRRKRKKDQQSLPGGEPQAVSQP